MNINLQNIITHKGLSLHEISLTQPVMVVFLRSFGCIFCKEALHDLAKLKDEIAQAHVELVFVHMASTLQADVFFENYGLKGTNQISDPTCKLYAQFGLSKGNFSQLLGLKTWVRGFEANAKGIGYSIKKIGDSLQMPGIFLICDGQIKESYIHKSASDKPDYLELINCCIT